MRNRSGQRHPCRRFFNGQFIHKELCVFVVVIGVGAQAQAHSVLFEFRRHRKLKALPPVGPGIDVAADIRPRHPAIFRKLRVQTAVPVVDAFGPQRQLWGG